MRQPDWSRPGPDGDAGQPRDESGPGHILRRDSLAARLAVLARAHPSAPDRAAWPAGADEPGVLGETGAGDMTDAGPEDGQPADDQEAGPGGADDGTPAAGSGWRATAETWLPGRPSGRTAYRPWFSGEGTADPWFAAGPPGA